MSQLETCPREYFRRSDAELTEAIRAAKAQKGETIAILGHHYQDAAIIALSDFIGDSFKLCRDAACASARYIIFCGVRFMAESARVVARPDQVVQHPEATAGCPMADMADIEQVEEAWKFLTAMQGKRRIVPVTYMNSDVEIKAFCGRKGGAVCTSSNAARVFEWAWRRGDTILFLPDEHLGVNTAVQCGMAPEEVLVWDPARPQQEERDERFATADLVVWKGYCHVHTHFTLDQVRRARAQYPGAHVIVHPECPREVVAAADSNGSTAAIVRRVAEAAAGETICIGTEINLVARLARERPEVRIVPLSPSLCPNMARITLGNLLWCLEHLGEAGVVHVDPEIARDALRALQQMLELS
jgi:quinolinate synthase